MKKLLLFFVFCSALVSAQTSTVYDFRDKVIFDNSASNDGNLTIVNSNYHGDKYGLNLKEGHQINIKVSGSATLSFLGSKYSSLAFKATTTEGKVIGTVDTQVTNDLSDTYSFQYTGDATTLSFVAAKNSSGEGSDIYLPTITVTTKASLADATAGTNTYYDFANGISIAGDTTKKESFTTSDNLVRMMSNNSSSDRQLWWHDNKHGVNFYVNNTIEISVAGRSSIALRTCTYAGPNTYADVYDPSGVKVGQFRADNSGGDDGYDYSFDYTGAAGTITLKFVGDDKAIYVHGLTVSSSNGKTDAWDFGAEELDTASYNNLLTVDNLNGLFPDTVTAGSSGNTLPGDWTIEGLTWLGNGDSSDRLRTSNTNLTRYDESVGADGVTGRVYANGSSNAGGRRYFQLSAKEYDQIEIWALSHSGGSKLTFQNIDDLDSQNTTVDLPSELTKLKFTAKKAGTFKFFDPEGKLSVYRVYRSEAKYKELTGAIDVTNAAGLPEGYQIAFTNQDGKEWLVTPGGSSYSVYLPEGQTFTYSLVNATGYKFELAEGTTATLDLTSEVSKLDLTILGIKTDIWDFGGQQFDSNKYNNNMTVEVINGLYDSSFTVGSSGYTFPGDWTVAGLTWKGNGDSSDRLRTSNTNLTRYDENVGADGVTGRVYANGSSNNGERRYFTLAADANDEIEILALSHSSGSKFTFQNTTNLESQNETKELPSSLTTFKFVAKESGTFKFFDPEGKLSVFRVSKREAVFQTLSGAVDISKAEGIASNYKIVFTNEQGKSWATTPSSGSYTISIPSGYDYVISLENANGYVLSTTELSLTEDMKILDLSIVKAVIYKVTGSISGLGDHISNLSLVYTPDPAAEKLFVPVPKINTTNNTYSVELEAETEYTITAIGVNDYAIGTSTITIGAATATSNIIFTEKPKYAVTITADELSSAQLAELQLSFTNLNEEGYSYSFSATESITLRNGVYSIALYGLDKHPLEAALISNLSITDAAAQKNLSFKSVNQWTFGDRDISQTDTHYKGMTLNNVKNEKAKSHLSASAGTSISVPLNPGEKMTVSYYYLADFSIDGGEAVITNSKSTGLVESIDYTYTGDKSGQVSITFNATTYLTDVKTAKIVPFKEILTVGPDKDFTTIGAALDAIKAMERTSITGKNSDLQRVTVMIDPGNYEEMLVVSMPNVTLKNAAANPSIALKNKGVDIDDNAVRITSYYGYGYHYFSQGDDNKWNAEVLTINKENGYRTNDNVSGTTKASYWNATVVVSSVGFIAEDIIFENSFNQYISKKESEDIVVEGNGTKGLRPTTFGDTSVQNRSFVERAAAIGVANDADKVILDQCRVVGRQDAFFGGTNARVVVYRGAMMGAVDYIFGGMTAVFYHTDFVLNTSDTEGDAAYITAAQQGSGRGYLMYECNIIGTEPGVNTASTNSSAPGYFGRPWLANTSEVVFYNTKIGTSSFPGKEGASLIEAEGWKNSLGGESPGMYEFGTIELSGVDNSSSRASWATALTEAVLNDGTEITTLNFTKGDDGWDPLPAMRAADDSDGDTIVDLDEIANGTDPLSTDTDGDGKGDLEEGTADFDGDGLIDAIESSTADADNDGLVDEKDAGNDDPLSDSDNDGYLDYDEVTEGQSDPNDSTSKPLDTDGDMTSNLNDEDDDNDGLTDAEEATIGTDPTLEDTDGDGVFDNFDNCPTTANADQSDLDFDGIGDVCDDLEITVAEAITPNSDGRNDFWVIKNILNHPNSVIRVFNRSGVEVYNAVNYKNTWDGMNKSGTSRLPSSSYYYTIDLDGNGSVDHQGWVYIASN